VRQRIAIAILALTMLAGTALAQNLPPGRWWHRQDIVSSLAMSEEQQSRLDSIFAAAANDLIDAKGDVEKAEIALHSELEQPQLNRENIRKVVARLNDARSRKFAREVMMLVDMRAVLSDQQWTQLRTRLDQIKDNAARPNQQMQRPRMRRQ
jgi:hypothetical protein